MVIKFRAWGKYKKKMHLDENYNKTWEIIYRPPYIGLVAYEIGLKENEEADELVLMQFTGLTDVNGKEIYEGDIIKYDEKYIAVVIWENGGFVLKYIDGVDNRLSSSWYDPMDSKITEVIGNVWENPNLLKGGKKWKSN